MTLSQINTQLDKIVRNISFINPTLDYIEITEAIIEFCNMVNEYCKTNKDTESLWLLEDSAGYCDVASLIEESYIHYAEYHQGQEHITYVALSQLGTIISNASKPDMIDIIYTDLCQIADDAHS